MSHESPDDRGFSPAPWSVYGSVFIPIGDYEVGRIASVRYEQLTADGNNSALLGDFNGRVIARGPELAYQSAASKARPATVDLRRYHEFEAKNRMEGEAT